MQQGLRLPSPGCSLETHANVAGALRPFRASQVHKRHVPQLLLPATPVALLRDAVAAVFRRLCIQPQLVQRDLKETCKAAEDGFQANLQPLYCTSVICSTPHTSVPTEEQRR